MSVASLNNLFKTLGYSELSEYLGVKENTLRCWVSQGKIPYTKIGRCVRFTPEQVQDILDKGRHEAARGDE